MSGRSICRRRVISLFDLRRGHLLGRCGRRVHELRGGHLASRYRQLELRRLPRGKFLWCHRSFRRVGTVRNRQVLGSSGQRLLGLRRGHLPSLNRGHRMYRLPGRIILRNNGDELHVGDLHHGQILGRERPGLHELRQWVVRGLVGCFGLHGLCGGQLLRTGRHDLHWVPGLY